MKNAVAGLCCVTLAACSLFGDLSSTPPGVADGGLIPPADGGFGDTALPPSDGAAGDASVTSDSGLPGCGTPNVFCDGFERTSILGSWAGLSLAAGGAASTEVAAPAPEGTRIGIFSVPAQTANPRASAHLYWVPTEAPLRRLVYKARLKFDTLPQNEDYVEIIYLKMAGSQQTEALFVFGLDRSKTLLAQTVYPSQVSSSRQTPGLIAGTWTTIEIQADLVGRSATLALDGSQVAQMPLPGDAATVTQLGTGLGYLSPMVHSAMRVAFDDVYFYAEPQ